MRSDRIFLVFAALGLAALVGAKAYDRLRPAAPAWLVGGDTLGALAVGGPAPEVTAVDAGGHAQSLDGLRGRYVLLNFWFSDCEPCREEMASLDRLAAALGPQGLTVVALSVDPSWDKVRRFHEGEPALRGRTPAYALWLDDKKRTPPRYGSYKFPETFLVGPDGALVARFVGPRDWSSDAALATLRAAIGAAPAAIATK